MTIGEHMREARNAAGLSINKLSMLSSVSPDVIWSSEKGRTFPNILNVIELADALGIGIDEYIGRVIGNG